MHRDGVHLLETVLTLHGIDPKRVETTVSGWTLDQLTDGSFDAVQGYTTTEPHALSRLGFATHLIPVRHHHLHPWAQMMLATDQTIAIHGNLLERFVTACKEGWKSAMTHRDEAADMIAAVSAEHGDAEENRRILDLMLPLIAGRHGLDRAVTTDPERWRRNLATYARFGMIGREPDYHEVVCDRFM
jgi:NitT/TauT family transport system substrate-binding protein